jgi:hypothetical protein
LHCRPNLIQSKAHPRGQPLLTLSVSKIAHSQGWIYGPLKLRAKNLIGCETPCETPGEFTDSFIVCNVYVNFCILPLTPFPLGNLVHQLVEFSSRIKKIIFTWNWHERI